jgi:hypothetical protein
MVPTKPGDLVYLELQMQDMAFDLGADWKGFDFQFSSREQQRKFLIVKKHCWALLICHGPFTWIIGHRLPNGFFRECIKQVHTISGHQIIGAEWKLYPLEKCPDRLQASNKKGT